MAILLSRMNDALSVNPPAGQQQLTENGSNWLWAVTAVYLVSFLAFFALTFVARSGEKIFHYLFATALLVGTIAYFAMAADLAFEVVGQANEGGYAGTADRQIFWAKYVNWAVSWPAIIIALGLVSGVSWATIFYQVALAWIWDISYLVAAFTGSNYKWGFFVFGTLAWLVLVFGLFMNGRTSAARVGVGRDFGLLAAWTGFLWLLYPIAWGLSDGGNRIGVTPSFVFFGILDVLLVPLIAFATLFFARRWDYGRLNIAFTQYGRVDTRSGTYPEKDVRHHGIAGHHNRDGVTAAPGVPTTTAPATAGPGPAAV